MRAGFGASPIRSPGVIGASGRGDTRSRLAFDFPGQQQGARPTVPNADIEGKPPWSRHGSMSSARMPAVIVTFAEGDEIGKRAEARKPACHAQSEEVHRRGANEAADEARRRPLIEACGGSICSIMPLCITAIRSAKPIASVWSCVT